MGFSRLIFPKIVEIRRFDTAATAAASGFDRSLRETLVDNPNDGTPRVNQRRETPIRIRAQIETDTFQRLNMGGLGDAPTSHLVVVFLASEMKAAGFVDPTSGEPLFKVTDRLAGIYTLAGGLILAIEDPPGLYAVSVKPCGIGFGFGRSTGYELVEGSFEGRPSGPTGGAGGL